MKALSVASLLGILTLTSSAFAQSLNCGYLENPQGVYAPGLSRPQVSIANETAEVLIYLEGGGGFSSSEHFALSLTSSSDHQRIYSHPEARVVSRVNTDGSVTSARVTVRGLTTNCVR
jgi:hypothetical protein